jgi:hypothetical protein
VFYPQHISYRDLLEFFFQIHDPTTLNRQGSDIGASYRSEIFYTTEAQRDEALRTIEDVNASGLWPGRVVTKVSPAAEFWQAEPSTRSILSAIRLGTPATSRVRGGSFPEAKGGGLRLRCRASSRMTCAMRLLRDTGHTRRPKSSCCSRPVRHRGPESRRRTKSGTPDEMKLRTAISRI